MTEQEELVRDDGPVTASKIDQPEAYLSAESVTIARPAAELFAFWREVANLPRFMENLASVQQIDDRRSRWTVKAPAGKTVSWESVITQEEPGRSISWHARDADVPNSGKVEFEDAGPRGTIVRAIIAYDPPAGIIGKTFAKMFQREPRIQSRRDLHRFKQLMEAGEIAVSARNHREACEREEEQ
jgi:uncharacterized membrane protein